jgi:hypothetical protein
MKSLPPCVLVLGLVLAVAGCASGQSPAERAVAAVEASYGSVRQRVRAFAPERAAAIELAIDRARGAADKGDWIGALAATQELPARIAQLSAAIDAEDQALDARWDSVNAELARALPLVDAGIERIAGRRRLPAGVTRTDILAARAELQAARIAWTHAVTAREGRRWQDAMRGAGEARLRARRSLDAVGLPRTTAFASPEG